METAKPQADKVIWWKLSLKRWPKRSHMHKIFPKNCLSSACEVCSNPTEDIDHMLFDCPPKHRFWKYTLTLFNIWLVKDLPVPKRCLTSQNIVEGSQYLWSNISLNRNPSSMTILSMAIATIWRCHWKFVFRDEEQDRLTYEQLVESLWHTLSTRIHEDAKKKKEKNNWLRKGVVEWYNDAIHITRPRIFIPL